MTAYAYYPGCSLSASGLDYDASFRAVFRGLGVELQEIPDWNCCGASSGFLVDQPAALAWNARNLMWAAKQKLDIVVPCTGCLKNMRKTVKKLSESAAAARGVAEDLGEPLPGGVRVVHPMEALVADIGWKQIEPKIKNMYQGIKVAPYYGCYLIRPPVDYDRCEDPQSLDELVRVCGGESVAFSYKTKCCGGGGFLTQESLAIELSAEIIRHAKAAGADAMLVACPLCDMLLDGYQRRLSSVAGEDLSIPVLYFTQFLGLALGIDADALGLGSRMTPVDGLLRRMGEAAVAAREAEEKRRAAAEARAAKQASAKAAEDAARQEVAG